ncbi:MAG: hypothetical protein KGI29_04050 [Pseudomonadota bacterium]|nr:hypothetical protein [Pseudomonadota bacterium]MDE3037800.1 hypothetical protein [Pseudomonadota bacterium]
MLGNVSDERIFERPRRVQVAAAGLRQVRGETRGKFASIRRAAQHNSHT